MLSSDLRRDFFVPAKSENSCRADEKVTFNGRRTISLVSNYAKLGLYSRKSCRVLKKKIDIFHSIFRDRTILYKISNFSLVSYSFVVTT